jgi:hypothetical protein
MLTDEGYDVGGVTLQLYDHGAALARKGACCAGQDIHDARRVAEAMGFPHYVLDYENMFRAAVIEEFADAYLAGATPVPCIRCNERVKFSDLLATAKELEADCMATGHYIRRIIGAQGPELHAAADPARDLKMWVEAPGHYYVRGMEATFRVQVRNDGAAGHTVSLRYPCGNPSFTVNPGMTTTLPCTQTIWSSGPFDAQLYEAGALVGRAGAAVVVNAPGVGVAQTGAPAP